MNARFQVGYHDDGVLIAWVEEESGQPHWLSLSPADAAALADALLRAVGDHAAHRKLVADLEDAYPDDDPQP